MLEIEESGLSDILGTSTVSEFRKNFSSIYWKALHPKITDGIEFLKLTEQGRSWLANMHADILMLEYEGDKK